MMSQGLKKVSSGCVGQEDFLARQVTFHSHLLMASHWPELNKEQTKTCLGQAEFESYLSQGQPGIQLFFQALMSTKLCNLQ